MPVSRKDAICGADILATQVENPETNRLEPGALILCQRCNRGTRFSAYPVSDYTDPSYGVAAAGALEIFCPAIKQAQRRLKQRM